MFVNHEESRTGAPKIIFEIAKELQKDFNVAMVSKSQESMHKEFQDNFKNLIYPTPENFPGISKDEIAKKIITAVSPKIVYANSLVSFEYAKVAKKMGVPSIIHLHELKTAFDEILTIQEKKEFPEYADIFIVVSEAVYNFLVKELACPPQKIILLNAFVNSENILEKSRQIKKEKIAKEIGLKKGETLVVSIGSLSIRKGVDFFVEAFKILDKKYNGKFKFLWIGKNHYNTALEVPENKSIIFLEEKENPFPYLALA